MAHDDSLPWVRLDSAMPMNKKIMKIVSRPGGAAAAFAWVCSLSYSGFQGSNGFVGDWEIHLIHCKPAMAKLLCKEGLWIRDDERGGYIVNDYEKYQQTVETTRMIRQTKAAGGIRGNHKQHHVGKPVRCNCEERIQAIEDGRFVPPADVRPVA